MIIDNRLARGSLSKTLLYCIKLREMDEEQTWKEELDVDDNLPPPDKRTRMSNDEVFLSPFESIAPKLNDDKESPTTKQSSYDNESMHMLLPKVPCLTPSSIPVNTSSSSSLTAYLARPPLNIPSLSLDANHKKMELPNQTNMSVSMPDISTLINKQNILTNSIASSYSILQQAMEPKYTFSSALDGNISSVSSSQANPIKLPINLSTLVPVSKQSLNMEEIDTTMSPLPMTSTGHNSGVLSISQSPYMSPFSLSNLTALSPLLPAISPQIQNVVRTGSIIPETPPPINVIGPKETKPTNTTNRRGRSIPNNASSGSTLAWPGVDAIVESYRKYNQGTTIITYCRT